MTRHLACSGNSIHRGGGLGVEQGRKGVAGLYMTSHFFLMKMARAEAVRRYEPLFFGRPDKKRFKIDAWMNVWMGE